MRTRAALALAGVSLLASPTVGRGQATEGPHAAVGAPVYGIHVITLKPGASGAQFERLFTERVYPAWKVPGATLRLVKGDRGTRVGQYLVVLEFETRAVRDRYFPPGGAPSAAWQRAAQPLGPDFAEWARLASAPGEESSSTDYEVVGTPPRATPTP